MEHAPESTSLHLGLSYFSSSSFAFFLNLDRPGFVFTGARIGAGNEVEGDHGNDIPHEDPIKSAIEDPVNDGSWVDPTSTAGGDPAMVTAPPGTLPRQSLGLPQISCFLLNL
jgi:hypothetical protein